MNYEVSSEAINIRLDVTPGFGYEGDAHGFDLLRRSIVHLIENYDTHLLEKEQGYEETEHFYSSVLSALARHYLIDDPVGRRVTVQQALEEMIENLTERGKLQEEVVGGVEDGD